ncbi:MAG TPA: hypothetical protein VFV86_13140 [Nitrososphaeraceae archaeon]|nr:hypothetical protein [Nitrososphaeraceae archaeon]
MPSYRRDLLALRTLQYFYHRFYKAIPANILAIFQLFPLTNAGYQTFSLTLWNEQRQLGPDLPSLILLLRLLEGQDLGFPEL